MFGKAVLRGHRSRIAFSARWRENDGLILVGGLAVLWLFFAAVRPAKADEDANPPKSQAKAFLRIDMLPLTEASSNPRFVRFEFDLYKNTQKQVLLNRLVLNAALNKLDFNELPILKKQADPIEWLTKHLQVEFPENTQVMAVGLSEGDPKERAAIVNAVVDAYLTEVVEGERRKLDVRMSELKRILSEKSHEIKDALNDLRKMAENLGTAETETLNIQQKNTLDELAALRSELLRDRFEANRMKIDLAADQAELETVENTPISDIGCELFAHSDFILRNLGREIAQAKKDSEAKSKADFERLEKEYSQRLDRIREELKNKAKTDIEKKIKRLEAKIALAAKMQSVDEEEVRRLRKEADRFGLSSIDMQMRREEIKNRQKTLDVITAELESLRMKSQNAPRVSVISKAEAAN